MKLVDYLGSPRRYMWFSAAIFKQELAAWRPGIATEDLSEADFVELLQRTSTRPSNHGVVRNYLVAFSGPQSWVQRAEAAVMDLEPRVEGRRVEYRPKEFEWLQCAACERWRRVDLSTVRVFANWHWRHHEHEERKADLCASFPRLLERLRQFVAWDGGSAAAAASSCSSGIDVAAVEAFLELVDMHEAFDAENHRGLLELVLLECRRRNRPCPDVQREVEALQNAEPGPMFRCEMLSKTTCDAACDHVQLFARHELAMYRETAAVTLHWMSADEGMSKLEGKVVRAAATAKPVPTGVCVVPDCENAWPGKYTSGCTAERRGQASAD